MTQIVEACEMKTNTTPDFPMGWYSVSRSHELLVGEVKRVYAFDRELALYRTRSGVAVLQDAFCPHLGAHLGVEGRVVGESLRCPFHGWRFDTSGKCVEIPYCSEIPDRAQIRMWPTQEKNGEIYIWFHPENSAAQYDLPDLLELENEQWTAPRYAEFEVPAHIQDIAENSCDPVHFKYVHKTPDTPPSTVTIDDDGRILHLRSDASQSPHPHQLHATVFQPGLALVRTSYAPEAEMVVYNSALPIDRNTTLLRWTLCVRREIEDIVGDDVMNGIIEGIKQDYPIWANKVHKQRPVFCREDKTLVMFRKWVRQFYIEAKEQV
ncbi:aromatic ring-hydroxylating dioxygenase subunit alpha [Parahaliea sp. F7430]|uniref:Aromatic ring-hydroxylating dioxygenase subunit alpha n=1 Tax=Sediminihaliea albiluteola TaxID=2758564 RepID=A0A7W2YK98_9GAMM|nr:Rieske 2Fe-2S domain-containing protein [Sediminihaliea albiluteola]MBA6413464.1 aromatic ring-hydroxylating dioxygenase subunit alpha [Sediminihaliea albiluteola]